MNLYEKLIVGFKYHEDCPHCDGVINFRYDNIKSNIVNLNYNGELIYTGKCDKCNSKYTLKPVIWGIKEEK